jgi:hypothetical protein
MRQNLSFEAAIHYFTSGYYGKSASLPAFFCLIREPLQKQEHEGP